MWLGWCYYLFSIFPAFLVCSCFTILLLNLSSEFPISNIIPFSFRVSIWFVFSAHCPTEILHFLSYAAHFFLSVAEHIYNASFNISACKVPHPSHAKICFYWLVFAPLITGNTILIPHMDSNCLVCAGYYGDIMSLDYVVFFKDG